MSYKEKRVWSEQLLPGASFSADGKGFCVNEATVCVKEVSLHRKTHKTKLHVDRFTEVW